LSTLQTRGFSQIVGSIAAGMQGRITSRFLNFAIGSMLRGLAEAVAGVALWLQKENLDTAKLTRFATSYGADVDSFVADFPLSGVTRLAAQPATGLCTFSRYTASGATVYVPVGAIVQTADGLQRFQVYADPANGAYVASYTAPGSLVATGGYAMPAQVASVIAPVQSITNGTTGAPGANGNVAAGAITNIASQTFGVDTVTNPAAFTNGIDVESDASVKYRFGLAVQGRGGGTAPAYLSAIANLKVGMTATVLQGQNLDGSTNLGMVSVIVDDGSGAISSALLAAAQSVISSDTSGVRAAGIRTGVYAAVTLPINVVMQVTSLPGYIHQNVVAAVSAALGLYINGLGQGATVGYFPLAGVAQRVTGVGEVIPASYSLNGGTADIVGTPQNTPKSVNLVIS